MNIQKRVENLEKLYAQILSRMSTIEQYINDGKAPSPVASLIDEKEESMNDIDEDFVSL